MPFGPAGLGVAVDLRHELGALELEWRQLAIDRLVEPGRRLDARLRQRVGSGDKVRLGLGRGLEQNFQPLLAGVDQRDVVVVFLRQRGEIVDLDIVFAGGGAQREQPLFVLFQFDRIEIGGAQSGFEMGAGFVQRIERGVERLGRRLDQ